LFFIVFNKISVCLSVDVDGDDVARGADAATLLDSTDTRNQIVDELMEVSHHYRNVLG